MDPLQQILLTAVLTLVVGVIGAYIGTRIQAARDHRSWLLDKQYDACRMYLISHDWRDLDQKVGTKERPELVPPADSLAEFALLGLSDLVELSRRLSGSLTPLHQMADNPDAFDAKTFHQLQATHDRLRAEWIAAVQKSIGVNAI